MQREQQQRIDAIRAGLNKIADASHRIWTSLNERNSRFDRHTVNVGLSPCEDATLIAQAAESVLADAELALAAAQEVRDQASMYRNAAVIEMNNRCVV